MVSDQQMQNAVNELKRIEISVTNNEEIQDILNARDEVIGRYGKMFNPDNIEHLSAEDFYGFLHFKNNKHWGGLYRGGKQLTRVMEDVRSTLKVILDKDLPLAQRIDHAYPKGKTRLNGMGKALLTAILTVVYPKSCSVWNTTSEAGLKKLNVWPDFERGETIGSKYDKINKIILDLSTRTGIDLWMLDSLFWAIQTVNQQSQDESGESLPADLHNKECIETFRLEGHLQDFLGENWENIEQLKGWEIFQSEGDEVGIQYPAGSAGYIDILAKHIKRKEWLVIELKRDQTSDTTLGQVQRYMGWVIKNLAETGDKVYGLIVAGSFTEKMKCAIYATQNVKLMRYRVSFDLEYENI